MPRRSAVQLPPRRQSRVLLSQRRGAGAQGTRKDATNAQGSRTCLRVTSCLGEGAVDFAPKARARTQEHEMQERGDWRFLYFMFLCSRPFGRQAANKVDSVP